MHGLSFVATLCMRPVTTHASDNIGMGNGQKGFLFDTIFKTDLKRISRLLYFR